MIEVTEEPYDSDVAIALVAALHADINERYAFDIVDMTPEEAAADNAAYLADVTPELTRRPLGSFVVAWIDGAPVGAGAVRPGSAPDEGEIKRMYTDPSARRRGVSRVVLARLEAIALELGYRRLRLETGTAQPEAIALYESDGWHRIEPYGAYRESPWSVCMAKDLVTP